MNQIYLIKNTEESYYKIGVTVNPQKRLSQLQTGCPSKLVIIDTYASDMAYKVEKVFHNRYSHLKKEGEWFNFSIVEEQKFKKECKDIENTLNILAKSTDILF